MIFKKKKPVLFSPKADVSVSLDTYQFSGNIFQVFKDVFVRYQKKEINLFLVYDLVLSDEEIEAGFMEESSRISLFFSWVLNVFRMGFNRGDKTVVIKPVFYRWCRDIPFFNYSKIESLRSLNRRFSLLTQELTEILSPIFLHNSYSDQDIFIICKHLAAHKLYRCDYFVTNNQILLDHSMQLDRSHHISVVSVEEFSFLSDVIFEI
ncbi:hypothetical protein CL647_00975 [bacterium]|mgnify:FL=1|nr:hypothetical protein [Actinomycetota bacterium]MBE32699.1 hypothetical protein [bacterium]|tara:strand:+ start:14707 stop:15327 length:621 start_codon:yes stop_codon:yes gene_type:complete